MPAASSAAARSCVLAEVPAWKAELSLRRQQEVNCVVTGLLGLKRMTDRMRSTPFCCTFCRNRSLRLWMAAELIYGLQACSAVLESGKLKWLGRVVQGRCSLPGKAESAGHMAGFVFCQVKALPSSPFPLHHFSVTSRLSRLARERHPRGDHAPESQQFCNQPAKSPLICALQTKPERSEAPRLSSFDSRIDLNLTAAAASRSCIKHWRACRGGAPQGDSVWVLLRRLSRTVSTLCKCLGEAMF